MGRGGGFSRRERLGKPWQRRFVVLGAKEHFPQRQFRARVAWLQAEILLEIRNSLCRILAEGRNGPHGVVVRSIVRLESHGFSKRLPSFRYQLELNTYSTERIVNGRILRIQVSRVGKISERA